MCKACNDTGIICYRNKAGRDMAYKCPDCMSAWYDRQIQKIFPGPVVTRESFDLKRNDVSWQLDEIYKEIFVNSLLYRGYCRMIIVGPTGTGKTMCLRWLYREFILKREPVFFINAIELKRICMGSVQTLENFKVYDEIRWNLNNRANVLIDDIASENQTESTLMMTDIENAIDRNPGRIIMTSNLRPGEIGYGERMKSRFEGMKVITLPGRDVRKLKKGEKP